MSRLDEIKNMALNRGSHFRWRLRSLTEEQELSASSKMVEGVDAFQSAFDKLERGDREGALADLKQAAKLAESAIETIEE